MDIFLNLLLGALSAIGFSLITNAPRRAAGIIGITGALSWTVFYLLKNYSHINILISNYVGAVIIGILAYFFARKFRLPENIIIIPCLVNLVPGGNAYRTILYMVQNNYPGSISQGLQTFLIASFIAMGLFTVPYTAATIQRLKAIRLRNKYLNRWKK
ncbi:threonine/serine exporter family protein [Companilactobacillus ginsenosidimutans]|uniref:threonine/serine exporter family protein n=1 Tax=Companilactobacillus ginsenosidimutans TaxID=1007676 RepID=UPI0006610535|nr:threonine/serine exporter family protein [Companilactobacillus ginsenosidimutans]